MSIRTILAIGRLLLLTVVLSHSAGCNSFADGPAFDATRAMPSYPSDLHVTGNADIQLFRDETRLTIANATPQRFESPTLWINQRYAREIPTLEPGSVVEISLWGFYDDLGERFNAGGFFRTESIEPIWIAQLQTGDDTPLVGLVTFPARRDQ